MVVGRGEKTYFLLLPKLFWGIHPVGMTDHPKEARLREEPLGACHEDRERKHLLRGRKGCHGRLINKIAFLCLEVGSGTQTNW